MYIDFISSGTVSSAPNKIPQHWISEAVSLCRRSKDGFISEFESKIDELYELIKPDNHNLKTAKARINYLAKNDPHYLKCLIVRAIDIGDFPIPSEEIGIKPSYVDIEYSPLRRGTYYALQHWRKYRQFYWSREEVGNAILDYQKTSRNKPKPKKYDNMVKTLRQIILNEPEALTMLPKFCLELLTLFDWMDIHDEWPLHHDDPNDYNMFKWGEI
jgi:hypothetical protein